MTPLFYVMEDGAYWDVVAVNPNNPNDRVVAKSCEALDRAEELTAALNRIAEIKPTNTASDGPQVRSYRYDDGGLDKLLDERPE